MSRNEQRLGRARNAGATRRLLAPAVALLVAAAPVAEAARALPDSPVTMTSRFAGPAVLQSTVANRVEQAGNLFDAIDATLALLDDAELYPAALAAKLGGDYVAAFEWVRDRTDWVPYVGALRGPTGVMLDRVGNSLDRSLLLAELLETGGHTVRLARASPGEAEAGGLVAAVRPRRAPTVGATSTSEEFARRVWEIIDRAPMPVQREKLREQERRELERMAAVRARGRRRVEAQTDLLVALVSGHIAPEAGAQGSVRQAMNDHWWVQVRIGSDWVDLDPLLPAAAVGDAPAGRGRSVSFRRRDGQIVLDRRLEHEVEVRVVVEQSRNGRQREREVISQVLRPRELAGRPVSLFTYPLHAVPDAEGGDPDDRAAALARQAERFGEWLPVLRVGRDVIYDRIFTADGSVKRPNLAPLAENERQMEGALGRLGLLDDALAGRRSEEADPTTFASAAWIEYEIRSPGVEPRVLRRPLFDLLGTARGDAAEVRLNEAMRLERETALTALTELLVVGSDVPVDLAETHTLRALAAMRQDALALAAAEDPEAVAAVAAGADLPEVMALELYALAVARAAWRDASSSVFVAKPNVLAFRQGYAFDAGGGLRVERTFDIVANGVSTLSGGAAAFRARLAQGVLDTNAEALLLAGDDAQPNAADLLERRADPGAWVVIGPGDDPPWGDSATAAIMRSLIAADLEAGRTIVVPAEPDPEVPYWWSIDGATGITLGMGAGGGQASTSYTTLVMRMSVCLLPFFGNAGLSLALCIAGATWAVPHVGGVQLFKALIYSTVLENLVLWSADPASWPGPY